MDVKVKNTVNKVLKIKKLKEDKVKKESLAKIPADSSYKTIALSFL